MNRRDLLKKIGIGIPAVAMVPFVSALELPKAAPNTPDDFMFHGWRVVWRGWRDMPNMDVRVGFWVGYGAREDQYHLYSAWPGPTGCVPRGGVLNIMRQADQEMPTIESTEADMNWYRNECLERLRRVIVKLGPPPFPLEKYRAGEVIL